jgi:hypothetical protein
VPGHRGVEGGARAFEHVELGSGGQRRRRDRSTDRLLVHAERHYPEQDHGRRLPGGPRSARRGSRPARPRATRRGSGHPCGVVDDAPLVPDVVTAILESVGATVTAVAYAAVALAAL